VKNTLIFSLLGGTLLFFWQFLSFAGANLHDAGQSYHPQQDTVLAFLESVGMEEGQYMMPRAQNGSSAEEYQAMWEQTVGKPWVKLTYYSERTDSMGRNMLRGWLVDLVIAFVLYSVLKGMSNRSFPRALLVSLGIGWMGFAATQYTNHIWYPTQDLLASLLDGTLPWILLGSLAFLFLKREPANR
jgi:hypothetical protein